MAPMTLYYFDIPGRGECARLLLTLGEVQFEVSASHTCRSNGDKGSKLKLAALSRMGVHCA